MKNATQQTARDAALEAIAAIQNQLNRLQNNVTLARMNTETNWGNVGDLNRTLELLKQA